MWNASRTLRSLCWHALSMTRKLDQSISCGDCWSWTCSAMADFEHIYQRKPQINRDSGIERSAVWNAVLWVLALYKCLSCVSLVGWRVLFFCRRLFSTLMVPFGLVHSVKSCDAIFLFYFISFLMIYLFIYFIFRFRCYGVVMTLLLGRPCISSQPMGCWYVVGSSFL